MLPELELELLGFKIFDRAGAGAYKLKNFLLELEQELRVLVKNVGAKSGAAKFLFQVSLEIQLKLNLSDISLVIIKNSILGSNNTGNLSLIEVFQNPHLAFYLKQMDKPN